MVTVRGRQKFNFIVQKQEETFTNTLVKVSKYARQVESSEYSASFP